MTQQIAIDFTGKLPVSAQVGMEQCDASADDRWKRVCDGAILAVARRLQEFTVDDVLAELETIPNPPSTHNLAALGPRMKKVAAELGYMEATERVVRSKRPEKHGNLQRLWRSKKFSL